MPAPLLIPASAARRFLVGVFALDAFQTLPSVAHAVERLEFVQEDSINVCGRIHDLILWPRVAGYAPSDLHDYLYGPERQGFEYYFPNLSVLPLRDYPHFVRSMQARHSPPGRWHGLLPEEEAVAIQVLAWMDENGPLRTRTMGTEHGHTTSGWGMKQTIVNRVTEKLWLHGHLTVAKRENFERWFDRTARLLPTVAAVSASSDAEEKIFRIRKRLRARRLFRLKKTDMAVLGEEAFAAVQIEGDKRPWHVLAEYIPALETVGTKSASETLHLLAPLDPLVYDRDRNRAVFQFDYTWEVYTPAAKRKWGYYVLPILHGDRLVGRVDPKIDRRTGTLTLHSLRLETGVVPETITTPLAERLRGFATFLGAKNITLGIIEPEALRLPLTKALENG